MQGGSIRFLLSFWNARVRLFILACSPLLPLAAGFPVLVTLVSGQVQAWQGLGAAACWAGLCWLVLVV